ncbi:hypothetical protein Ahy_B06g082554 [Arachis hypogaea]|uniref:Aminotransferase-like plant mobile domain-containing protein n=1 Tax=Arachis hypogaea TaxID=3818 RepID=A0A444YNK3_ARAHY|nr:hypothetical protein Ahy_B06g082554 [Arachis hypogaea]
MRCYIMLLIGGYLMTDKSNNQVHLWWLPFRDDFQRCHFLSWGSAVLVWTYHSLCSTTHRATTDIAGYTPLLISSVVSTRVTDLYVSHGCEDLCLLCLENEAEWGTWMSIVPLVCFNIVEFHHEDRPVAGVLVNVDRFLTSTGRGEDVWWPTKLWEWYDHFRDWFEEGHYRSQTIGLPRSIGIGTSRPAVLDTCLASMFLMTPGYWTYRVTSSLNASQARDVLHLPWDVPDHPRHDKEVREDLRRHTRREKDNTVDEIVVQLLVVLRHGGC